MVNKPKYDFTEYLNKSPNVISKTHSPLFSHVKNLYHGSKYFIGKRSKFRNQEFVSEIYDDSYSQSNEEWLESRSKIRNTLNYEGYDFEVNGWLSRLIHARLVSDLIKKSNLNNILEIGSGRGFNIAFLRKINPYLNISGVEKSEFGVLNSLKLLDHIPEEFSEEAKLLNEIDDPLYKKQDSRVSIVQGDATNLNFEDDSFDISFTVLVFEQIPHMYTEVLKEMRRVTKHYCIFMEPFREVNSYKGLAFLRNADYFRYSYDFSKYGFENIFLYKDFPQKAKFQVGLSLCKVL